jgi:serine/threonine protein kinase/WD40 repeat protein/DNA-binding winged helix-turn-helix (wHTH) protein
VQFTVLGSLEVHDQQGRSLDLSSRRQRRLLAALIIHAGSVVSDDRLTEMVWDEERLPDGGVRSLRTVMSRLRSTLEAFEPGATHVHTRPPGYVFDLNGSTLDAAVFEHQLQLGKRSLAEGDATTAIGAFDSALKLWRGGAYAEFASEDWARAEAVRLEELRAVVHELRVDARMMGGGHAESIGELEQLVATHPFRERPRLQLITALYRSGRQADALHAYQTYRELLADEMGLKPSVALQELEIQILRHDVALDAPPPEGPHAKAYKLVEKLGAGAWGEVWRARQPSVDRDVAVKVISRDFSDDEAFIRRFEVEARIVAGLEHPHVTPLYDYWRDPTGAYLVMRLLRGGSAADHVATHGPWALAAVTTLVDQMGGALAAAHRAGVVHRDVKPANILLDTDGNAYLGDFGVAVYSAHSSAGPRGEAVGSPAYAAPEQLNGSPVGQSADIYGLAVTAWELLCGHLPQLAQPVGALIDQHQSQRLPSLRGARPDLPAPLDSVLQRATEVDPAARFATVTEFVEAFRSAAGTTPITSEQPSPVHLATDTIVPGRKVVNPYKGLRPFGIGDATDFFGRDDVVDHLVDVLADRRFVAVVGPSGTGKSSVVRAGLLPALREGRLPRSAEWFVVTMLPGANPYEELEAALLHVAVNPPTSLLEQLDSGPKGIARAVKRTIPGGQHELLLVIDQFEELFTQSDPAVADRFIEGLATAVTDSTARLRVVVTLRADFFDRPLADHRLANMLGDATVPVGALNPGALAAAISGPAQRVGIRLEPSLAAALLADASGHAAALPLLQYMLTELFDHRVGDCLTHEAYIDLGGLRGVIAQRAESLYGELDEAGREAARLVFGRLVTLGEGVADTRRRARRAEVETTRDPATSLASAEVIDRFGGGRLLVFDRDPATREPTVEIAHEALLEAWPRLREWIEDDREVLRTVSQISAAAVGWQRSAHDDGDLLRGARLSAALDFEATFADRLTAAEGEFVVASRAAFEREQGRQRRQNRRLRTMLVGTALLLVGALVAGGLALQQRSKARDTAFDAQTRRVIAESARLIETDTSAALLLALESTRRESSVATLGALQRVFAGAPHTWMGMLSAGYVADLAFLPNGNIVNASGLGLSVWSVAERRRIWFTPENYTTVAASPTGDLVAAGGADGKWHVFDASTGELVAEGVGLAGQPLSSAAFDTTGTLLALGALSGRVVVEDLSTGNALDVAFPGFAKDFAVTSLAFDAEGTRLAAATGRQAPAQLWDLHSGALVGGPISPDGEAKTGAGALVFDNGLLWAVATQLQAYDPVTGEPSGSAIDLGDTVVTAGQEEQALARVGDRMVVAGVSGVVSFDLVTQRLQALPIPSQSTLLSFAIDPTAGVLAQGPGGIRLWSLDGAGFATEVSVPRVGDVAHISLDGRTLLSSDFGAAQIWELADEGPRLAGVELEATARQARMVDNTIIRAVDDPDAPGMVTWQIWDTTARRFVNLDDQQHLLDFSIAAAVDDRFVAIGQMSSVVNVFARDGSGLVTTLQPLPDGPDELILDVEFSPDGRRLIMTTGLGMVAVYDTATWKQLQYIEPAPSSNPFAGTGFHEIEFTPDGRFAVTNFSWSGIQVRDADTLAVIRTSPFVLDGLLLGRMLDISSDGSIIQVSDPNGAKLVDFDTLEVIGDPYPHDVTGAFPPAASLSHDRDLLATNVGDDVVVWNVDIDSWPEIACQAAGRNLSRIEWEQYGFDEPYHLTCPQWPEFHLSS